MHGADWMTLKYFILTLIKSSKLMILTPDEHLDNMVPVLNHRGSRKMVALQGVRDWHLNRFYSPN